jgi:hypothetical protein
MTDQERNVMQFALSALEDARCILNDWRNIPDAYEDEIEALRTVLAQPEPKLIGWRTDNYLKETNDKSLAENWEHHHKILPIFEGDPHTKLAQPDHGFDRTASHMAGEYVDAIDTSESYVDENEKRKHEPVAWMQADQAEVYVKEFKDEVRGYTIPLYTAPVSKQEPVTLESVYETIIHWDNGGGKRSRRELARQIVALYTAPVSKQEPWDTSDMAYRPNGLSVEQEPVTWNGWVLREVFFDNGEPCGHREPPSKPCAITDLLQQKFQSGNNVPVERITITLSEYEDALRSKNT